MKSLKVLAQLMSLTEGITVAWLETPAVSDTDNALALADLELFCEQL
jgi:hypothetical protein